ncbi:MULTISPECIES: sensor domain-containing protein [Mycobacterium]|uniref:Sensor domain-containing protein n=1 Tax=Mycobacterium colombiense TaxID=339268 RepID=A0A329M2K7_9MYCO|nr:MULTISPECIES: sensor domain-containing protein [Mycobacterium]MDM4140157.1 sensor domain-containing protein [Mycobacterium sp. FLAC0960]RAV14261.1 sensor domain-containing protein [Mycobacterium colombiense]
MVRGRIAFLVQAAASVLVTGCTTVVGGSASPADTSGPLPQTPVAAAALDGLLLDVDQINSLLTSGMRLRYGVQAMWDWSSTFSDKSCLAMDGPAQEAVYADTGWIAVRGQRLDDSFDDPAVRNDSAIQAVIAYPSARKANAFYDASVRRWSACANRKFSEHPSGKPEIGWTVGEVHKIAGMLSTSEVQDSSDGWTCQRALTARNNVVIDVATCGSFLPGGSAVDLAEQIAAKVTRQ